MEERNLLNHYLGLARSLGLSLPSDEEAWLQYREAVMYGYYMWGITRRVDPPIIRQFTDRLGRADQRTAEHRGPERHDDDLVLNTSDASDAAGDALGLGEGGVLDEAKLRREFERDGVAHFAAQKSAMTVERRHHRIGVLAAQGLDEHGRVPHVGRRLHLRHRDGDAQEIGIADFVGAQNVGKRVAQHFAHPQLTLRRP